ncbi:hypothetical protein [Helicobacter pylori]
MCIIKMIPFLKIRLVFVLKLLAFSLGKVLQKFRECPCV